MSRARPLLEYNARDGAARTLPMGQVLRDALLDAPSLPSDTRAELGQLSPDSNSVNPYVVGSTSLYFAQYCPAAPAAVCRPHWLWQTDLSFAFEPG